MRTRFFLGLLLITATIFLLTLPVMAVTIGFDDLADMTPVTNQYLPLGVTFSTTTPSGNVISTKEGFNVSPPNVLFPKWVDEGYTESNL